MIESDNEILDYYKKAGMGLGVEFKPKYVLYSKEQKNIFDASLGVEGSFYDLMGIKFAIEYEINGDYYSFCCKYKKYTLSLQQVNRQTLETYKLIYYPKETGGYRFRGRINKPLTFNLLYRGAESIRKEVKRILDEQYKY